jgi:excisionase family DNA binding protein
MESPVMTVQEVAEYLKVSTDTVYVLVRSQTFPAIKIGNSWRILRKELDEWLRKQYNEKPENLCSL